MGGHIGYVIRPSERGKGYGSLILKELLKKAKDKGVDQALLTCDEANTASRNVIEANQVVRMDVDKGRCRYWLQT